MEYDHILIRFGEISTKGRNRKKFIDQLAYNIKTKLIDFSKLTIEKSRDRIFIKLNGEENIQEITYRIEKVFGIHSFSLAIKTDSELTEIKDGALTALKDLEYIGKTFKISAKRADKQFPLDTNELNHAVGSHILTNTEGLRVDVHNPEINVRVEVRHEATYITCKDIRGAGGLPVGSSGKAMLMLSGGIDSPVAGYLAMKKGLHIEAVHFFSPPFTNERSKQKVIDLTKKLTQYGSKIRLHIVPFTDIQQTIQRQVPENYTLISTRRMMLKITDEIRNRNNGLAIVTGESLGQVASQTLESMYTINQVTSTPVIRPLVSSDKTEIIEISRNIDTYDISILPYEDCCTIFTPASPKTRPKLEKVMHYESFVDFDSLIEEAISKTEIIDYKTEIGIDNSDLGDLF
ncbi:tRNA 4-thiouridine(8) synthase ThiI [Cytobacillus sp. S13-E01]|uniref:tRNA uracil 4-sulfurtransferase ThiI n=1 Tax=Cytobacillus sp. S13-E01 TaxID=3031326 RepID=UPI0023D7C16F|nr:tRNA uracil 4-sulfurtransferase ThiI [Cytobacillus sp. S13-E01]MDF0726435.1 tRNA 4-thiouridine(8) synthase ThiI [Cytobacillus sp. S13-E01]